MAIKLFQRKELPPGQAAGVKVPVALADNSAQQRAIGAGMKFAGDTYEKLVASTAANEKAQFHSNVGVALEDWNIYVSAHPGASYEELGKERVKMIDKLKIAGQGFTTKEAQQYSTNYLIENQKVIAKQTQDSMETIRSKQILATSEITRENLIANFDREGVVSLNNTLADAGQVPDEIIEQQNINDLATIDAAETKFIQKQAVSTLETNMVTTAANTNWDDAIVEISDPANLQVLLQSGMGLEDAKKVLSNMKSFASSQRDVAERKTEVDQTNNTRDFITQIADSRVPVSEGDTATSPPPTITELTDAFRSGAITEQQYNGLVTRLNSPKIKTDRVKEAELYTMSLDIWRGSTTKAQFDAELNKNSASLDDPTYGSLSKSASDTLRSSQAEALSRANTEAGRLIVDHTSEDVFQKFISDSIAGLDPDAANLFKDEANEIRQEQFFSLSQYNAELRDWITENPDKVGKEFFQFSESLKHTYWNKSRQTIQRNILEARTGQTSEPSRAGLGLTDSKAPVPVADQAAYDKLKSGTRYVDKNGNVGVKR